MATGMDLSVEDQLTKLEAARILVLTDSALYTQIVQGILPIIGANARIEIRRWGAEFLAETFASPMLALQQKERLAVFVLQTLKQFLEIPGDDNGVVKSVVQAATSIYGLIFRYIIANPHDSPTWDKMAAIKSNIIKRWDTASTGVRTCCIKFVQKVVLVQTPGVIADPRRPDQNEISLALVPRDHPLIPPPSLEPEASGLLDRMLNIFHEDSSDAVLVTATLNCLGPLIRSRQTIVNKILSVILGYNPLKKANSPMTPISKVQIKALERTTRALLLNFLRRNENSPFAPRIKQYIDRLMQARMDIFDDGNRKRGHPSEPADIDSAKRLRLGPGAVGPGAPPLPSGPVEIAHLFTLTSDEGLASFDVTQLPIELVVRITLPVLLNINQASLDEAINFVRSRYQWLTTNQRNAAFNQTQPDTAAEEEEDDYEPDFASIAEDSEQILNKDDALPSQQPQQTPTDVALGPFRLQKPPPLTEEESHQIGQSTINRVFGMMNVIETPASVAKRQKPGLNRLAGSTFDREAWITIITRLATRASAGLEEESADEDDYDPDPSALFNGHNSRTILSDSIREKLWKYVVEDFRARIHIAIGWLNEEWFNDQLQAQSKNQLKDSKPSLMEPQRSYEKWVLKVLDFIIPYLDAKDKLLIRFLSEIPAVDEPILERVKGLARDPERVVLAVSTMHYLILVRLPVREMCLNALEDLWRNNEDAKAASAKILTKWRPQLLAEYSKTSYITDTNGTNPSLAPESAESNAASAASEPAKSLQGNPVAAAG